MMYQDFLSELGIISEEEFNEVINSLPEKINIKNIYLTAYDSADYNQNLLAQVLLNHIISIAGWKQSSICDVDFDMKLLHINTDSLKELDELEEFFSNSVWSIENYGDLRRDLESIHKTILNQIYNLLKELSPEDLEKFKESLYDYKK